MRLGATSWRGSVDRETRGLGAELWGGSVFRAVILSLGEHQHHSGLPDGPPYLGPFPDELNQNPWGWAVAPLTSKSFLGDFNRKEALRTAGLEVRKART